MAERTLRPTLWRTCRVLANQPRLKILVLLARRPSQTVTAIARQLRLSVPAASQYLRALEARGLLEARRAGPHVEYRSSSAAAAGITPELAAALRKTLEQGDGSIETVFSVATAFTHPRRIEILRVLNTKTRSLAQLQHATLISSRALRRHLQKLVSRGFVTLRRGDYVSAYPTNRLARELKRLALG